MLSSKDSLNIGASYLGRANFNNGFSSFSRLGTLSGKTLAMYIKSLFANNEVGFAYDPNDLSTLYQDAAGTIPVTAAGQPAGLVLDKSKGVVLGVERLTNGDFESRLPAIKDDGTTAISTWGLNTNNPISGTKDGLLTITQAGASRPSLVFTTPEKSLGGLYELSFDYKVISGNIILTNIYNGSGTNILNKTLTGAGRATLRYISRGVDTIDALYFGDSVGAIQIDNVSVRQVLGNHAYQATPSMRPILRYTPSRIDYDGIDDKLVTNLPVQLTGATVIRAVPNVGTQILTNQTISTPYNDSTDHCGLIVINRALTQTETTQITQAFNKIAGV